MAGKFRISEFVSYSAVVIGLWTAASTVFGVAFIGYFGLELVKYFSILDIQYNFFSYAVLALPLAIYLGLNFIQFAEPTPNDKGEIRPLFRYLLTDLKKPLLGVAVLGGIVLYGFVLSWPFIWPDMRMIFPSGSVLREFVFIDPVILLAFTGPLVFTLFPFFEGVRKDRALFYIRRAAATVFAAAILYIAGDTTAAFKANHSISAELANFEGKESRRVMFYGEQFSIVIGNSDPELVQSSSIKTITPNK